MIVNSPSSAPDFPFDDTQDFIDVRRGFLGTLDSSKILNASGDVIWNADAYTFVTGEAAATVHPSLWRQSQLVAAHGLFEVVPGIYQGRGFDLSNITFVESDNGVIVIDPLISTETAAAALELYREHRGDRAVVAVIYTHSHADHFGGVKGVTTQAEVDAGTVAIYAPDGFMQHAIEENLFAGTAMSRRANYMYGVALPISATGGVGAGLGQTTSRGTVSLIAPTVNISITGETHVIDGVRVEFQMAPGTEAPSEMHFLFPDYRALCMAENATHTLHNLLTLRGAVVRDPHIWSHYLTEAIARYTDHADVAFASHHWPTWGKANIVEFLSTQRDLYAYLHDQTLRMINQGFTGSEIAETLQLPPALTSKWHTHGYYGSVSHNVKAIYQRYMGWYDGNPARLWQHTPVDAAVRYVEYMGGADSIVAKAQVSYDAGDYRWVAEVLDHVVFAEPDHAAGKALLADTLEQLGFGSENGTWRSVYLSGAMELRTGNFGSVQSTVSEDILKSLSITQFFDAFAIQIDGPKAWHIDSSISWNFTDTGETYRTTLKNGVLVYVANSALPSDLTLTLPHAAILALAAGSIEAAKQAGLTTAGDETALTSVFAVLSPGDPAFNIVTP
ncbi:alkyl/aryl-sulfatase [Subtercola lobariae]|uniref:Linear primary-alkylsulfatase n=1 Tax=Subtercola lobariae TaxID=1588641 RepID=A0A917B794_9MICO|nr:alkyl sulfatase dimerization domain-containing protein [Subtercola lobariae]GGF22482.1 hydrolase [Subtercola lobariae]